MDPFALPSSPNLDVTTYGGNSATAGASWYTWIKPIGKSRLSIVLFGGGGGGGAGAIGAASTAAGGGGGGSGAMTVVEIPLSFLPARLYVSIGIAKTGAGLASYVSTQPNIIVNHVVTFASGGGAGGNAVGAAAGAAGTAGATATAAIMPLGWAFAKLALAGQAGIVGGTNVNAANITQPITGLRATGATGGGGLAAAATTGRNGGSFSSIFSPPTQYITPQGGVGSATATDPADNGSNGTRVMSIDDKYFFYGGTGGASTHGSATGTGLVQSAGGNGNISSGGGGSGGALTGSTPSSLSFGGSGMVVMTCY